MKKQALWIVLFALAPMAAMAEIMEKAEPSLYVAVGAGGTKIDNKYSAEANLEADFGVMFRTGHSLYLGFQFQKLSREPWRDGSQIVDKDHRTSRTNFPVYLMYQYRFFGWNKNMADKHRVSPFVGAKCGWNFLQDIFIGETVAEQNLDERKMNLFGTPLIGFDYRVAEYFTMGIVLECEISRRYMVNVTFPDENMGSYFKPRACVMFRF